MESKLYIEPAYNSPPPKKKCSPKKNVFPNPPKNVLYLYLAWRIWECESILVYLVTWPWLECKCGENWKRCLIHFIFYSWMTNDYFYHPSVFELIECLLKISLSLKHNFQRYHCKVKKLSSILVYHFWKHA